MVTYGYWTWSIYNVGNLKATMTGDGCNPTDKNADSGDGF